MTLCCFSNIQVISTFLFEEESPNLYWPSGGRGNWTTPTLNGQHVRDAIDCGVIVPGDLDPFDPEDNNIGPSVHSVVQQMIRPISERTGGQSWALLQNPDGLFCDLFTYI